MAISFGPGGNSDSFTSAKLKFPADLTEYLSKFGLNGYEIECGRGVRIGTATYDLLPDIARKTGLQLSLHAPYFISLSSVETEKRAKSVDYILESAAAAKKLGAKKIVVHSGSCSKIPRSEALALAKDTLCKAQETLDRNSLGDITICPETMGKINQLGTLDEVLELCSVDERFLPCIDFGHLNARTLGGIKTSDDYDGIFERIENKIGSARMAVMHIHFSMIEFTKGGEKTHLTFNDGETRGFGPAFEPLLDIIAAKNLTPSIICESQGTQAEDAGRMLEYYRKCSDCR